MVDQIDLVSKFTSMDCFEKVKGKRIGKIFPTIIFIILK